MSCLPNFPSTTATNPYRIFFFLSGVSETKQKPTLLDGDVSSTLNPSQFYTYCQWHGGEQRFPNAIA